MGTSDRQLHEMRRTAARAAGGATHGDLGLRLATAGAIGTSIDPALEVTAAPIRAWSQAILLSGKPGEIGMATMKKALGKARAYWRPASVGPARALLQALARIKWQVVTESKFLTEDGIVLDLEELSTAYVVRVALQSIWKWVAEQTAYSIGRPDLRHGIWWQPIHSVLRSALRAGLVM